MRLCTELLESFPPQCGGASVLVEGLDPGALRQLPRAEGMVWSQREVELSGTLDHDVLRVSERTIV